MLSRGRSFSGSLLRAPFVCTLIESSNFVSESLELFIILMRSNIFVFRIALIFCLCSLLHGEGSLMIRELSVLRKTGNTMPIHTIAHARMNSLMQLREKEIFILAGSLFIENN